MSRFLTTLQSEQLGKWQHLLLADLVFEDELGTFTAPAGFVTDFASLQVLHNTVLFVLFALVAGYGNLAATIHDKLYSDGYLPRRDCDAVFYRALRAEGVAEWRAWIMWAGVRLGGASCYGRVYLYFLRFVCSVCKKVSRRLSHRDGRYFLARHQRGS